MGGNGLDAFPEQLPRGIGHGKIRVPFAVEQGVLADDLNANRADDLSVGSFNHLKFGQSFFQFTRREAHGIPERLQTAKIVRCGAANAKIGRTHRRFYTKSAGFIATGAGKRVLGWLGLTPLVNLKFPPGAPGQFPAIAVGPVLRHRVVVQFHFLVGRASPRAGSSVASPHQTVPLPGASASCFFPNLCHSERDKI